MDDIRHAYGENKVLKGVSFQVQPGEMVCILGYSGSGKTTLLNILSGLLKPDGGSISIDSTDIELIPENEIRTKYIGIIFQKFELFGHMNVLDNVVSSAMHVNQNYDENVELGIKILSELEMKSQIYKFPNELSGGQKQRVGIARALINNPKLMVADEPTSNIDTKTSMNIIQVLKTLTSEHRSMIYATHNLDIALFADRIFILKRGKLSEVTKEEIAETDQIELIYEETEE